MKIKIIFCVIDIVLFLSNYFLNFNSAKPVLLTNINNLPGMLPGRNREMPEGSPFKVAWWYRTEFKLPAAYKGKHIWLQFHSINYKANIWLNGKLIADTLTIEGAYRLFNLDISNAALPGKTNCLALEIFPPKGMDLTITWVDWNPTTPDKGMGIWYDVSVHSTGAVAIEDPHVVTKLNLPSTYQASLTVSAEIRNADEKPVSGTLKGTIENISFLQKVTLKPGETKTVTFVPENFPQLVIANPRLWWPHTVGPQNLYDLRLHKAFFPIARTALESRYGKPAGVEEYCTKSQVFQQEAAKAMFEAFAGNKYRSSGIIYWMYNSAWPKMYWQLYDYFLMPNGAFYGAKNACEPLHIQYCYDDNSIKIVNSWYHDFKALKSTVRIFDFNMKEVESHMIDAAVTADTSQKIFTLDIPKDITKVFFLKLELKDASGKLLSSNFYWLSANGDEKADFTDLNILPKADLNISSSSLIKDGTKCRLAVTIENKGTGLAFAVNPKILMLNSKEPVLPVFWEDNYFSLLPNEKRTLQVEFDTKNLNGERPVLKVDGWNVIPVEKEI